MRPCVKGDLEFLEDEEELALGGGHCPEPYTAIEQIIDPLPHGMDEADYIELAEALEARQAPSAGGRAWPLVPDLNAHSTPASSSIRCTGTPVHYEQTSM